MVKYLPIVFIFGLVWACTGTHKNSEQADVKHIDSLNLIPYPESLQKEMGYFTLNGETYLDFPEEISNEGKYLTNLLKESCSTPPKVNLKTKIAVNRIQLELVTNLDSARYSLTISTDRITIAGGSPQAVMYGIQTMRQLFVPAFHRNEKRDSWHLPCLSIEDSPKFEHRGLLMDVCRHFFEKDVMLKYIDALAYYKMNVLHFHLTEDQGWRIPIEKYPLLNEISSWRTNDSTGQKYGGYYTKAELKEIVAYAAERHITVIPEVELPGHAQAALAAYPQFSCNGGPIEVANDWGVFKEIYCAGNDSTFTFLEDVLTEVMDIFPSEYIHIGGDEAPKFRWEHCKKCQKRMQEEGLADEHELQSYFIKRIEKFLNENGRKLIGWDEILEGGLSDNAAVQSWRGMEGGIEAAQTRHEVIMSPTSHCYLDYSLSSIDLQKIYGFDPIPADLDTEFHPYIIGGECNMWTERVPTEENLDSKVFPRMIALAEVLWSYPEERDFDNFYQRLQEHYETLTDFGIDYGLETIGTAIQTIPSDSGLFVQLERNLPDLDLKYRWNNKPDTNWLEYEEPIPVMSSGELMVQALKNEKAYGNAVKQAFIHHNGLNAEVDYTNEYNKWYTGNGEKNLVDGAIGSLDFRDGNWQGFWGKDADVIIDLGKPQPIQSVGAHFYQYANSWIFLPQSVTVTISEDREIWTQLEPFLYNEINLTNQKEIQYFECLTNYGGKGIPEARYIHFVAEGIGKVPDGHEAAGQDAWVFIDEIVVK